MPRPSIILAALLLLLVAALGFKEGLIAPLEVRTASQGGFDTQRALARLERILGDERPHPVDSADNDAVRERLFGELGAMGLRPRVTDDFVCNGSAKNRAVGCARVRNVVATIGPAAGRRLLLVSHYDSTPVGPGAADDGIGVAVMLETVAQLKGRALKQPVTLLFNEGEEAGLLGARAFMERDPLAAQVATILNFEARGVNGPAIMFETSDPGGAAVALYARSAERPAANSLATDFARLIPNSTDVAVLKERDWTILNFAIIGNETRYHSPGDTLAALDPRSVQHMGDQALALASDIAAGGSAGKAGSVTYTDLLGRTLIVIPTGATLFALAAVLFGSAAAAWRRRRGVGRATAAVAAALLGGTALSFLAQGALKLIRDGDYWRAYPIATDLALYASVLFAGIAALLLIARSSRRASLRAAFWLLFLVIGAGGSVAIPGAAIFFLLPGVVAVAALLIGRRYPRFERWGAIAAAFGLFLLWAPLLALMGLLLRHESAWLFAPVAAIILLPWLIEMKPLIGAVRPKAALVALGMVAVLAWAGSALVPAYSGDRKQMFGIEYAWDASKSHGQWLIANDGTGLPDGFNAVGAFEPGTKVPWSSRKRWVAAAPARLIDAPAVEILFARTTAAGRVMSLRLRANGAETIILRGSPEAQVRAVRAGGWSRTMGGKANPGKPKTDGSDDYFVRCHGRSCDGLTVDLLVGSARPLPWTLIGMRRGLPPAAMPLIEARPKDAAPQYNPDGMVATRRIAI